MTNSNSQREEIARNDEFNRPDIFLIERLPCELLFAIVDYAPELVYDLRQCSKLLRSRVDRHAPRPANKLVEKLSFHSGFPSESNSIVMTASKSKNMLDLHLKLMQNNKYGLKIIVSNIARSMQYQIPWNRATKNGPIFNWMQECIGKRMGIVELIFTGEYHSWIFVFQLLKRVQFKSLRIQTDILANGFGMNILQLVNNHSIHHLYIFYVKNTLTDSMQYLIELSSLVRSIHIDPQDNNELSNLFGIHKPNGAGLIIDMFSRKLDQLFISCYSSQELLPEEWINTLCKVLPYLQKRVWFTATGRLLKNRQREIVNEHIIEGTNRMLTIKHISREYEE